MRLFKAVKHLFTHYKFIMPTFLIGSVLFYGLTHFLPFIGTVLILPIHVGIAYVMLKAASNKNNENRLHVFEGFKKGVYGTNVVFLFLRQIAYLLPLFIGGFLFAFFRGFVSSFSLPYGVSILNAVVFIIPSMVLSLMLAMVPYLLADHRFDQTKRNPFKASLYIMKGNYIKLLLIRAFFIPWLILQSSTVIYTLISYYERFVGETDLPLSYMPFIYLVLPLVFLIFLPWYHMMHAELYVKNRHKLNDVPK